MHDAIVCLDFIFFFKQKTAYEMRISDWSSDVCSSDLVAEAELARDLARGAGHQLHHAARAGVADRLPVELAFLPRDRVDEGPVGFVARGDADGREARHLDRVAAVRLRAAADHHAEVGAAALRRALAGDWKRVVQGKRVSVRVDL